jgi:DNA repair photolyase
LALYPSRPGAIAEAATAGIRPEAPTRSVLLVCEHVFVRWDNLERQETRPQGRLGGLTEAKVRTFDAPEALGIRFHEIEARSALNSVPKRSRMPFRWTINPYRGCTHACVYCFARPTHTYLDLNAREDFEREIVVKVNVPELVRAELRRPSWTGEHVALGTNTDPYQWVESKYRLMPGIWEAMRDYANPCSVLTKSPLLLRDIEVMKEISERTGFVANLSIPTLDEKAWRATEPHTPHPRKRIEALAELKRAGISTGVLIAPLIPGVNDAPEQVEPLLALIGEAGAGSVAGVGLHLRGEVREIFFDWLRQYRPDLIPRYEELYARGAYMAPAERDRLSSLVKRGARGIRGAGGMRRVPPKRRGGENDSAEPRSRQGSLF